MIGIEFFNKLKRMFIPLDVKFSFAISTSSLILSSLKYNINSKDFITERKKFTQNLNEWISNVLLEEYYQMMD